jgi:hypothetical protein
MRGFGGGGTKQINQQQDLAVQHFSREWALHNLKEVLPRGLSFLSREVVKILHLGKNFLPIPFCLCFLGKFENEYTSDVFLG